MWLRPDVPFGGQLVQIAHRTPAQTCTFLRSFVDTCVARSDWAEIQSSAAK